MKLSSFIVLRTREYRDWSLHSEATEQHLHLGLPDSQTAPYALQVGLEVKEKTLGIIYFLELCIEGGGYHGVLQRQVHLGLHLWHAAGKCWDYYWSRNVDDRSGEKSFYFIYFYCVRAWHTNCLSWGCILNVAGKLETGGWMDYSKATNPQVNRKVKGHLIVDERSSSYNWSQE